MNDERDTAVREREHADHARWAAQHRAWSEEARGWLEGIDEDAAVLRALAERLGRNERERITAHLDALRRHDAAIAQHEVVLASLDRSRCAGCEPLGAPSHAAADRSHVAETTSHDVLAERRARTRVLVSELAHLLEPAPEAGSPKT